MNDDCKECGRPTAKTKEEWFGSDGGVCGVATPDLWGCIDECRMATVDRLKARVTELEKQLSPRLRVWELTTGTVWCVAADAEDCWGYLEDRHGDPDEITELKEDGACWVALPDDKKMAFYVDSDGDVCNIDYGAPLLLPCWVWAVRRAAGFLGEDQ